MADPSRGTRRVGAVRRGAMIGVLALGMGGLSAAPALAQFAGEDGTAEKPPETRGLELQNNLGDTLPLSLELVDSNGKTIKLGDKFGKGRPVVITMLYFRCPLLCPQMQQRVIGSFNQIADFTIGTDYDAMFVSFDPRDSSSDAAKAKELALMSYDRPANEPVRQGLSYLVGKVENTQELADALGFPYRFLKESGEFSHGTAVYVVTPEGVISACFTKLEYDPGDLRLALVEASGGKIGTLLDTFTLWCYHSTITGEYQLAAMKVMRIGAALSAAFVFGLVGFWVWRDRRRRRLPTGGAEAGGVGGTGTSSNVALNGASLGHSR